MPENIDLYLQIWQKSDILIQLNKYSGWIVLRLNVNFLLPPNHTEYEQDKRGKFLHISLIVTIISGLYFSTLNVGISAFGFYLMSTVSLIAYFLNKSGKYLFGALLLLGITIFALFLNFYDGISLEDPGIVAFPLILILSGFLFNSIFIFPITGILLAGIHWILQLERAGMIFPSVPTSDSKVMIIDILVIITAILLWVIINYWEKALEETRASEKKLQESYLQSLEGWAKTLELRDGDTKDHSSRVTNLTLQLAKALGINDPDELTNIYRGSLLHDIGKIAIPDKILFKKDDLTTEDWIIIKKHPLQAKELLEKTPFILPSLSIPCFHHENWDGTGYPLGISGNNIPIHARIFAIADNWDALTSDRHYRPAWNRKKVLDYIRGQAGIKFDPEIVPIFLEMIKQNQ